MNAKRLLPRSLARVTAALALAGAAWGAGCSRSTAPEGEISTQSRQAAAQRTEEMLRVDATLQTSQLVEDLTGGFARGMAAQTAGLDMELGGELPQLKADARDLSLGAQLAAASRARCDALSRMQAAEAAGKTDPAPGDLLLRFTETHLDGSVTVTSIYQDSPLAVVKVERVTTWPGGNLLLERITDEIYVDRGADLVDGADDVWLSLAEDIEFVGGERLVRAVDARDQGGLQDDLRVDVVSTFFARPDHPRLLDIVTVLTVDVHALARSDDDRFVAVERTSRFTGRAHDGGEPRVIEQFTPESPLAEGEAPCGGDLSRTLHFRERSALAKWTDHAGWTCAGEGLLSRQVAYADGSEASLTLQQDAQGIVTLDAHDRDGSVTTGRFDEAARTFQIETTYAPGADPVSRSIQGTASADGADWSLDEQIAYRDGFVETNHLEGSSSEQGKHVSGVHQDRDERVQFELTANADESVLQGHVENDRDESLDFRLELLLDGSRLVDFTALDAQRRVEGHLEVDADGCGEGTLTVEEDGVRATFEITFCEGALDTSPLDL